MPCQRRVSLFCGLLLAGCAPQLTGTTPAAPPTPDDEELLGAATFAALGPNASQGADVIILDARGRELSRLPVGNFQAPWEEHFSLAWHHHGFFIVSTANSGGFLTAVEPITLDRWEFGAEGHGSGGRSGVATDGSVLSASWDELFSLDASGNVLDVIDVPLGAAPWTDAIETVDGMLAADFNGRITRSEDGELVHDGDGVSTDFVGIDGTGAVWMGGISNADLTWVEAGGTAVHLGPPEDLGLYPSLLAIETAGPESVWVLNVDAYDSSRVSQVNRSGFVQHLFESEQFWVDLVVLDSSYPQQR